MKYSSIAILLFSLSLISLTVSESIPYETCEINGEEPIFIPEAVILEPKEPVIGEDFKLTIKGTAGI